MSNAGQLKGTARDEHIVYAIVYTTVGGVQ